DAVAGDQTVTVDDATGSGAGWNLTATATQFTDAATDTLPVGGTFSVNGSVGAVADATVRGAACPAPPAGAAPPTCTVPTNTVPGYPVPITTDGATPATLYSAAIGTG